MSVEYLIGPIRLFKETKELSNPHCMVKCMRLLQKLSLIVSVGVISWGCESNLKPEVVTSTTLDIPQEEAPKASPTTVSPMLRPPQEEDQCHAQINYTAPSVIRRLTRAEYRNTVRELLGVELDELVDGFPPEEEVNGFDNQSKSLQVSALHVEQFMKASERLAEVAVGRFELISPCVPMNNEAETCIVSFIENFGRRAWRRPLQDDEIQDLLTLYRLGVEGAQQDLAHPQAHLLGAINPINDGLTLIMGALFQSPHFLYRVEVGVASVEVYEDSEDRTTGEVRALSSYELASRLSYLLWRSMPDEELFMAASSGALNTESGLMQQAERMLLDSRSTEGLWSFFEQWLALDEVKSINKDKLVFPSYHIDLNQLLETEVRLFVEDVIFVQRDMRTLFNGSDSFMNAELARHYALGGEGAELRPDQLDESPEWAFNINSKLTDRERAEARATLPNGEVFHKVALNPNRRSGLMTRGAVLALTTKPNMGDPVHRGIYIRERLLCTPLPPPPPDIVVVAPDPDPTLTTREQFQIHSSEPACAGCHQLVDPLGFGLEGYDPLGRVRELENGKPIDDRGEFISTLDIDGSFQGSKALGDLLSESQQVQRCVVLNLMRYAYGRSESAGELCDIDALYNAYSESNYDFLTLLRAIIRSPGFSRLHIEREPNDQALGMQSNGDER
jgi:hypothetical protein